MKQLTYIKATTLALSLAFLAVGCSQERDFLTPNAKTEAKDNKPVGEDIPWIPGEAYVKFKKKPSTDGLRSFSLRSLSADAISREGLELKPIFDTSGPWGEAIKREGLDRWYSVSFSKEADVHAVIEELRKDDNVENVHGGLEAVQGKATTTISQQGSLRALSPNAYRFEFNDSYRNQFDDPMLPQQWHYQNNGGGAYPYAYSDADINLFKAWDVTTGDPRVVVAVIDAGVDFSHPDLAHAQWTGTDEDGATLVGGWNFVKDIPTVEPGYHGTHVAGTIAAKNNNGIGGAGIAGGNGTTQEGVKIMSLQVFSKDEENGGGTSAKIDGFARAFTFAAKHGALIANCSWGFSYRSDYTPEYYANYYKEYLQVINEAVNFFNKYAGCNTDGTPKDGALMTGGLVFFASGNDGVNNIEIIPSSLPQVVSVAAYRADWNIASYANKGKWVDILAPGGDVTYAASHLNPCFGILSTVTETFQSTLIGDKMGSEYLYYGDSRYAYAQGTSMATPHVTGVAALVISHFGPQSRLTSAELRQRILSAVKPIDHESNVPFNNNVAWRGNMGVGYLDAGLALAPKGDVPPTKPDVTIKHLGFYDVEVAWQVTEDKDDPSQKGTTFVYDLYLNKGKDQTSYKFGEESAQVYSRAKSVGEELTYKFDKLETNQDYTLVVVARDRGGNTAEPVYLNFKTEYNQPPRITNMVSDVTILDTKPYYEYDFEVEDGDGHAWSFSSSLPPKTTLERKGNKLHLHINTNGLNRGKHKVEIRLYDLLEEDKPLGGETLEVFEFELRSHQAPKQVSPISQVALQRGGSAVTINLADIFAGTTGQSLSYKATSRDESIVKASVEGQSLVLTPGNKAGYTSVSLVVSDGGKQTVVAVQVLVSEQGQSQVYALYPQPAHSYMRILVNPSVKSIEAIVTSMRGEVLQQETLSVKGQTNEATLEIDRLAPGTYHLLVKAGGVTSKHTFIKN